MTDSVTANSSWATAHHRWQWDSIFTGIIDSNYQSRQVFYRDNLSVLQESGWNNGVTNHRKTNILFTDRMANRIKIKCE